MRRQGDSVTQLKGLLVAFLFACLLATAPLAAAAPVPAAVKQRLASEIEKMRKSDAFYVGKEWIAGRAFIVYYYTHTDFNPIWVDEAGAWAALEDALQDLTALGLNASDYHADALKSLNLLIKTTDHPSPRLLADYEILATDALFLLANARMYGKVEVQALLAGGSLEQEALVEEMGEGLFNALAGGRLLERIRQLDPPAYFYQRYQQALAQYREIAANGGWPPIPAGRVLRRGDTGRGIVELRRRLQLSGDFDAEPEVTSPVFDYHLETAVRNFQARHGMQVDGVVGRGTLAAMNVPLQRRIDQIRANLERARWVGRVAPADAVLAVNLTDDTLDWVEGDRTVWQTRIRTGLSCRQLTEFRAAVEQVEFHPAWAVSAQTLRDEVVPRARRDPRFLQAEDYVLLTRKGEPVGQAKAAWARFGAANWPYIVVQEPGPRNPLGRVRFDLPNREGVTLHDGPGPFSAVLAGTGLGIPCIRVEDPERLAELVLAGTADFDADGIEEALQSGATRAVKPARAVSAVLAYWTVLVDDDGRVHFLADRSGADAAILEQLDSPYGPRGAPRRAQP